MFYKRLFDEVFPYEKIRIILAIGDSYAEEAVPIRIKKSPQF